MKFAKELRQKQTKAEDFFRELVRNRRVGGLKFRRQHPIGRSIVDFFCKELELVIELDGSVHDQQHIKNDDKIRQKEIELQGKTVLRFTNNEILNNTSKVIQTIIDFANTLPSPHRRGQG